MTLSGGGGLRLRAVSASERNDGSGDRSHTSPDTGGATAPQDQPGAVMSSPQDEVAAWEEFYDWSLAQCWGPNCPTTGAEQFQAMLDKLAELGLPTSGR